MNSMRLYILLSVWVIACIGFLAWRVRHVAHAKQLLQDTRTATETSTAQAEEILRLRQSQQQVEVRQRPTRDVIAQVNTVLADSGLPAACFKSLTPESDVLMSEAGPGYKKQTLRLMLDKLSIRELGEFLLQWRKTQASWTVERIELLHIGDAQTGGRFAATMLLSAVYLSPK